MKIYDISPPISKNSALFPGDTAFESWSLCSLSKGNSVNLTGLKLSPHVGAHADAPSHFLENAESIDTVNLDPYLGECWVISCLEIPLIEPHHLKNFKRGIKRILFRTLSHKDPNQFTSDFTAISQETVEYLGKSGVVLVGIDTPSIDPAHSKDLLAHKMLGRYGMRNLEGLHLREVHDGKYELIALPLKLVGLDASPVRAVLREIEWFL